MKVLQALGKKYIKSYSQKIPPQGVKVQGTPKIPLQGVGTHGTPKIPPQGVKAQSAPKIPPQGVKAHGTPKIPPQGVGAHGTPKIPLQGSGTYAPKNSTTGGVCCAPDVDLVFGRPIRLRCFCAAGPGRGGCFGPARTRAASQSARRRLGIGWRQPSRIKPHRRTSSSPPRPML